MQKYIEKIKSFFEREKKIIEKPIPINPYKAWAILFGFISILLLSFFAVNTYFFFGVKNETLISGSDEALAISKKYNHDSLDKALESFLSRNKKFEEIRGTNSSIIDPSM